MKQNNKLLLLILFFAIHSCKKEGTPNVALPAITQNGQNTLGFNLDNKVWSNYGKRCTGLGGCKENKVSAYLYKELNGDFNLEISAGYNTKTIDQVFYISTKNIISTGTFNIDSSLNQHIAFFANQSAPFLQQYKNRQPNKCFLTFTTFDTTNKIIAGVFNATLYNSINLNDSVKIENGRFDAKLDYK